MYEVNLVEEIDDARMIDADSEREAVEQFVETAVDEGWWDDVEVRSSITVTVSEEGTNRSKRFRAVLDEETLNVAVVRL